MTNADLRCKGDIKLYGQSSHRATARWKSRTAVHRFTLLRTQLAHEFIAKHTYHTLNTVVKYMNEVGLCSNPIMDKNPHCKPLQVVGSIIGRNNLLRNGLEMHVVPRCIKTYAYPTRGSQYSRLKKSAEQKTVSPCETYMTSSIVRFNWYSASKLIVGTSGTYTVQYSVSDLGCSKQHTKAVKITFLTVFFFNFKDT